MSVFSEWPHQWFGFWYSSSFNKLLNRFLSYYYGQKHEQYPLFSILVDNDWQPDDKSRISEYLSEGNTIRHFGCRPYSCHICRRKLPNAGFCKTDGHWVWTGYLHHYVEYHNVRIPDAMVSHIRNNDYEMVDSETPIDELPWPTSTDQLPAEWC